MKYEDTEMIISSINRKKRLIHLVIGSCPVVVECEEQGNAEAYRNARDLLREAAMAEHRKNSEKLDKTKEI